MPTMRYLASMFFAVGIFGILHHRLTSGTWWQWGDILTLPTTTYPYWHHEPLILILFLTGGVLLIKNWRTR